LQEEHATNVALHTENYKTDWTNVWVLDACTVMGTHSAGSTHERTKTECVADYNGLINQGIAVALANWYE